MSVRVSQSVSQSPVQNSVTSAAACLHVNHRSASNVTGPSAPKKKNTALGVGINRCGLRGLRPGEKDDTEVALLYNSCM